MNRDEYQAEHGGDENRERMMDAEQNKPHHPRCKHDTCGSNVHGWCQRDEIPEACEWSKEHAEQTKPTEIDDGGPAFPGITLDGDGMKVFWPGATLRDWFAGQALEKACRTRDVRSAPDIAKRAYFIADAMLTERGRR